MQRSGRDGGPHLHGEHVGEQRSERSENDQPCSDDDEYAASPSLDGRRALLHRVDDVLAS